MQKLPPDKGTLLNGTNAFLICFGLKPEAKKRLALLSIRNFDRTKVLESIKWAFSF
jgi:hypothetical protein